MLDVRCSALGITNITQFIQNKGVQCLHKIMVLWPTKVEMSCINRCTQK